MQSISLVPSTAYNNSIYTAEKKNCDGGVIVLEDRITEYYMDVQSTTAVSVDLRLLHQVPNSTLQFTLIVYSTGNNVLNLSGFNIEQIQVVNGKSVFTVMKGVGDAAWNIQMTSSDVRSEQWLRCYIKPYNPQINTGIFNVFNLNGDIPTNLFSKHAPGQQANDSYNPYYSYSISPDGYICTKFPMPVWLKSICIAVTIYTNVNINNFPTSLRVYGTNDGIEWTQILSTELTPNWGSVDTYLCTTNNYYTMFKYCFGFSNNASNYYIPFIALTGFVSELIGTGAYSFATPYCPSLPFNGYNIETNASDMSSSTGDTYIYRLTQFGGDYDTYNMNRGTTDTPWEYIYTFPEAIRTIGFSYARNRGSSIKLFSLSYSDDKTTWTEYCKVDGTINAWDQGQSYGQLATYFCDSNSEHRYYKITIYSNADDSSDQALRGLEFIQFQKGYYFTFESFIPKLRSNTQSGYILVASNSSDGDAYKMFDQSVSTYGGGAISDGEWSLLIQLPEATVVRGLEMVSPTEGYDRMPYAFSIQGSQDNDTWTNIKTFMLGSNYWSSALQLGQWDIENETAYLYYRLVVTATAHGSVVRIGEMGLSSYASFKGVNWYEDEYLVPVMSSNSQDGYIASGKSQYSNDYAPWKAFDRTNNSGNDCWVTNDSDMTNGNKECNTWLQIQLPIAQVFNILNIVARYGNDYKQAPSSFVFKGSNDGENWTSLLTVTDQPEYRDETWVLENSIAYSYYRIDITKTNAANVHVSIGELNLINRIYHEGE